MGDLDPGRPVDLDALNSIGDTISHAGLLLCDAIEAAQAAGEEELARRLVEASTLLADDVIKIGMIVTLGRNLSPEDRVGRVVEYDDEGMGV